MFDATYTVSFKSTPKSQWERLTFSTSAEAMKFALEINGYGIHRVVVERTN